MQEYAITVLGRDRAGIIAETTGILSGLGLNLTDSTMTRLRGHFAMTLVCAAQGETAQDDEEIVAIQRALAPLTVDGTLTVTVRQVAAETEPAGEGPHYILTVHGADRLGIVTSLTGVLADVNGNITDLTTRLVGDLYLLIAEVDFPPTVNADAVAGRVSRVATDLGVEASLRPAEADLL